MFAPVCLFTRGKMPCMNFGEIEFISGVPLPLFRAPPHACPYLPDRVASELIALPFEVTPAVYEMMLARRFRRAGEMFYSPSCEDCLECTPIRVPVAEFRPSDSQRRVLRRNQDVRLSVGPLCDDDERFELYSRYQHAQHDGSMACEREQFERLLCRSPIETVEMSYRVGDQLVGVGVVDVLPNGLSSVYFYYEPDEARRSLGVFSSLCEIEECKRRGLEYWHIGFYIRDCEKMSYKNRFAPRELLTPDQQWRRSD